MIVIVQKKEHRHMHELESTIITTNKSYSHVYLEYIIEYYDALARNCNDVTVFIAFERFSAKIGINATLKGWIADAIEHGASIKYAKDHKIGAHSATYDFNIDEWPKGNELVKINMRFGEWFENNVTPDFPNPVMWWGDGPCFAVTNRTICKRSRSFYEDIIKQFNGTTSDSHEVAHFVERAWYYIFMTATGDDTVNIFRQEEQESANELHRSIVEEQQPQTFNETQKPSQQQPEQVRIKLLYVWSDNMIILRDNFLKSISSLDTYTYKICDHYIDLLKFTDNKFGFRTESWHYCLLEKIRYISRTLDTEPDDAYIVCSDIDIQFFNPSVIDDLIQDAQDQQLEYYGMYEDNKRVKYNGGFYVLKASKRTRDFYHHIVKCLEERSYPFGDQDIINADIDKYLGDRHQQIPASLTLWGGHGVKQTHAFHHAVFAKGMHDKVPQLISVFKDYMTKVQIPLTLYSSPIKLNVIDIYDINDWPDEDIDDQKSSIDRVNIHCIVYDLPKDQEPWDTLYNMMNFVSYIVFQKEMPTMFSPHRFINLQGKIWIPKHLAAI